MGVSPTLVIPAKAGIQKTCGSLNSGLHRNDVLEGFSDKLLGWRGQGESNLLPVFETGPTGLQPAGRPAPLPSVDASTRHVDRTEKDLKWSDFGKRRKGTDLSARPCAYQTRVA